MNPKISILTVGSELLNGRVQDTNAYYLTGKLHGLGFEVSSAVSVPDDLSDIVAALRVAVSNSSAVVVSGGIGPTTDDLTREAVAEFAGVALQIDKDALTRLHELYHRRQRPFDPSNTKQASFPQGAHIIMNPVGTAAGFWVECPTRGGAAPMIIVLPGVPKEFRLMCEDSAFQLLTARFPQRLPLTQRAFRIFGVAEAVVGSRISKLGIDTRLVKISYRAHFPEVQLVLESKESHLIHALTPKVREVIGPEYIFSEDLSCDLGRVVHDLLIAKKLRIALAESCTGGLLGSCLVQNPGASEYFMGSAVVYSNEAKIALLGVSPEAIQEHGAASEPVAREMAAGAKRVYQADLALSITGIAGPDGGTPEKPVGTFIIGFATNSENKSFPCYFLSTRDAIQHYAVYKALDILRRHILFPSKAM